MKYLPRTAILFLMTILTLLLTIGCGTPASPQNSNTSIPGGTPAVQDPNQKRIVTVGVYAASHMRNTDAWLQAMQITLQSQNPNVLLKIERFDPQAGDVYLDNVAQNFALSLMAGKAPDVMIFSPSLLNNPPQAMQQGYFEDLTPWLDQNPDFHIEDFYAPIIANGVVDEKRFLLPLSFFYQPMFTTKEIANRIGYSPEKPLSLTTWMDLAIKNRKEQYAPLLFTKLWVYPQHRYPSFRFMLTNGYPNPCDPFAKQADFDTPQFRESLAFLQELAENQGNYYADNNNMTAPDSFSKHGGVVFDIFTGMRAIPWEAAEYFFQYCPDQEITPMNYPVMPGDSGDIGFIDLVMAVNSNCKDKETAAAVCVAMVDKETQCNTMLETEMSAPNRYFPQLPVNRQSMIDYCQKTQLPNIFPRGFKQQYLECLDRIQRGVFEDSKLFELINKEITRYFEGVITQDELVEKLNQKVNLYLKE